MGHKFDESKMLKLNDPGRFDTLIPAVMWGALAVDGPSAIVDLGAGTGLFAARFAELAPDATVFAVDVSEQMIEYLRENLPQVADGSVVPVLADETHIPLDDGVADAVVAINLHHELDDPVASYREAARVLAPGGRVLVVDWAPFETPKGPPLEHRSTPEDIAAALAEAGLSEVRSHAGLPWHSMVTATK